MYVTSRGCPLALLLVAVFAGLASAQCTENGAAGLARAFSLSQPLVPSEVGIETNGGDALLAFVRENPSLFAEDGEATRCAMMLGAMLARGGLDRLDPSEFGGRVGATDLDFGREVVSNVYGYGADPVRTGRDLRWLGRVLPDVARGDLDSFQSPKYYASQATPKLSAAALEAAERCASQPASCDAIREEYSARTEATDFGTVYTLAQLAETLEAPAEATEEFEVVRVHYATDRARTGRPGPLNVFDGQRGELVFGRAIVSIPGDRATGEFPRPDGWFQTRYGDPAEYIMVLNLTPLDRATAFTDLGAAIAAHEDRALFVFVHGYNVPFDDALARTAQLSYDLGVPGAPLTFSWPANGKRLDYVADRTDAEWAAPHLASMLRAAREELGAEKVHVIAHSMGSRVVLEALEELRETEAPVADHLVFAAPDIDADNFRNLYPTVRSSADRMTLYVSANDTALRISKLLAKYPRLGDPSEGIVVLESLETIDATAVDDPSRWGHAYFGEALPVVTDLFALIKNGLAPEDRMLDGYEVDGLPYWLLRR